MPASRIFSFSRDVLIYLRRTSMKSFKRFFAVFLSMLMLSSAMVFTASAGTEPVFVNKAHTGMGFSGEAVAGTKTYDSTNDIVYYHYVPKDSADWMHFGWHDATGKFEWTTPLTVGMIMRTNKAGAVPSIRLCDRSDAANKLTINKKAPAVKGDGTWEVVWFPEVTAADVANVAKNGVSFDGLTHVQCFAAGEALIGNAHLESDFYFDIAGYAFFDDTNANLAAVDLYAAIGTGAPTVKLSFDAQNGTEASEKDVTSGDYLPGKIEFPEEPEAPSGKVFLGWSTDKDAETGSNDFDIPNVDTTYYAIWGTETWLLKGSLNGGSYGNTDIAEALEDFFANGMKVNPEDVAAEDGIPNIDSLIKPYRSGYTLAGWGLTADATPDEAVTFPYVMTGDTTLYAIWVYANDTPLTADEELISDTTYYYEYKTEAEELYADFEPTLREDLGEFEYYGAYSVKLIDAYSGEEKRDAHFSVEIDISDIDLEGKFLYVENAETNGKYGLEMTKDGKCVIADIASGAVLQIYTLDPIALYELEGTYYSKRGEYKVEIYLDSDVPLNAGSLGIGYICAQPLELTSGNSVQYIASPPPDTENNFMMLTWGASDAEPYIGGNGRVHIGTILFSMTEQEREWYLVLGNSIGVGAMDETEEIYDGEYYLVAEHEANSLSVNYIPAMVRDITDTVGPDDMVTVKGTVEMSAREDGKTPVEGNYATLYWRNKGGVWNKVVIEDADTDTAVVEYTLENVPADVEIEIYVEKNGYLKGGSTYVFDAKTDGETDEQPERVAEEIDLVPGDIKGKVEDSCGDGVIDLADFVRVLRGFSENATDEFKALIDIDENGDVNVTDLGYVKANFGKTE